MESVTKLCRVIPRNEFQYIPGILVKQERIDVPSELPLTLPEIRRCLSYANVYEVVGEGNVLLTLDNYTADNSEEETVELPEEIEFEKPRDPKIVPVEVPKDVKPHEPVEFVVETVAGAYAGRIVIGSATGDMSILEKIEYWEIRDSTWHDLPSDGSGTFGPFPLADSSSRFRATFKQAGTCSVTFILKDYSTQEVVCEIPVTFECKE